MYEYLPYRDNCFIRVKYQSLTPFLFERYWSITRLIGVVTSRNMLTVHVTYVPRTQPPSLPKLQC